tara:strand:- start:2520 stop:2654 length:135 start_codon:yes stop_codon:yes gene_type:complete
MKYIYIAKLIIEGDQFINCINTINVKSVGESMGVKTRTGKRYAS